MLLLLLVFAIKYLYYALVVTCVSRMCLFDTVLFHSIFLSIIIFFLVRKPTKFEVRGREKVCVCVCVHVFSSFFLKNTCSSCTS